MMRVHRAALGFLIIVMTLLGPLSLAHGQTAPQIERESVLGPVRVRLFVSPAEPVIGDVVELELIVEAEAGVEVLMPEFGEALGRFEIIDFVPTERELDEGRWQGSQRYRLQPPHSGTQTIPPLRVEFVDRRPGRISAPTGEDAYEILTDRIALEVASVLSADAPLVLRPAHSDLGPRTNQVVRRWAWILGLALVVVALGPFAWKIWFATRENRRRQSAYQVARAELDSLLATGRPNAETMDAFYVQLSLVVRTYLEDRFGLRSPELTTQEFLAEMGRSPDLARSHQRLLQSFLEQADLVKFAGYRPSEEVVSESIGAAEQFLRETRDFVRVEDGSGLGETEHERA